MFSVPPPTIRGGSAVAAAMLRARLQKHVELFEFSLGRKTDTETLLNKVMGRLADLVRSYSMMRRRRPDAVHLNTAFDPRSIPRDALFVLLAQSLRIPVLLLFHGSADRCFQKLPLAVERAKYLLLRYATRIGVLSQAERVVFERAFPHVADRVRVVKNVVDDSFLASRTEPCSQPKVLFISRFLRAKGPFDLLDAIPRVISGAPGTTFTFAGDGEDLAEFVKRVEEQGLTRAVNVLGNIDNKETVELYRRSWMLVFPSHFPEGMPMAVAEALGCGLPIITTPTRFAESYLRENVNALYIPRGNSDAIADCVLQLIADPALRAAMGCANRQLALHSFSDEVVCSEFLNIYCEMASLQGGHESHNCRK